MTRKSINRRTFLRGAGTIAVALPWLEAMGAQGRTTQAIRAADATAATPNRFVCIYVPLGTVVANWFPTGTETNFVLPSITQTFAKYQSQLLLFQGVDNKAGQSGFQDGHAEATSSFLSGVAPSGTSSQNITAGGITLDQVLASRIGQTTRFGSLTLGVHTIPGCVYSAVSYAGAGQMLSVQRDPSLLFAAMFGDAGLSASATAAKAARRRSILDSVLGDYQTLNTQLGSADRVRVDAHIASIRDIETRLSATAACAPPQSITYPTFTGYDTGCVEQAKAMFDLMVLALSCDLTRCITLVHQFEGQSGDVRTMPWLNPSVTVDPHGLSHYPDADPYAEPLNQAMALWYAQQTLYFIDQLAATPTGDGRTLFDHTLVMQGHGLSHANAHSKDNLPIMLAGSLGGAIRSGRFLDFSASPVPHNNLLLGILNALAGSNDATFGDPNFCTGAISLV